MGETTRINAGRAVSGGIVAGEDLADGGNLIFVPGIETALQK
jgi:hypothetical protein